MDVDASGTVLYRNIKCCNGGKDSSLECIKKAFQSLGSSPENHSPKTLEDVLHINEAKQSFSSTKLLTCPEHKRSDSSPKNKCYQYKVMLQRIRSLLDEIKAIRKNETTGIICEFCKRYNSMGKCKRCEILANRSGLKGKDNDPQLQRFVIWLSKVKQFLFSILESEATRHKLYHQDLSETDELTKLLNELKLPLNVREPYIRHFSSTHLLENLAESNNILKEVELKLKTEKHHHEAVTSMRAVPCPSTCKYFVGKITDYNLQKKVESKPLPQATAKTKSKSKALNGTKMKDESKVKADYHLETKVERIHKSSEKDDKSKNDAEDMLMASMLKSQRDKDNTQNKKVPKSEKLPAIPEIEKLPTPQRKASLKIDLKDYIAISESVIECDVRNIEPTKMIKGIEVVPLESRLDLDTESIKPMLYKVKQEFINKDSEKTSGSNITSTGTTTSKSSKLKNKVDIPDTKSSKGIISYQLSNREFIEKGWTMLPTTKIMRRMNIYKMVPSSPQYDWFKNHQNKGVIMYDTGERLADIDDNGDGKWYYKNGMLALNYYSLKEPNSGHRYIVYSSGEKDEFGRKFPVTVLATFDHLGNGIVYDHHGNVRLKYNQSEGVIIDAKIGAPGVWKWHTLNEPPVLQRQFIDNYEKSDACIEKLLRRKDADKMDSFSKHKREPDLDMIAIELENIIKEKANKLLQEFKPFQIKTKALKINEQFSLKILDQSKIYLIYRDGQTYMKLNLGMLLLSNEIVDTVTAELFEVATPYDHQPPKTQSIADIQNILEKSKKFWKTPSGNNERKT
ncbi:hypothetical protein evm_003110 [Chilo suppressalis]|nr:hypothetical protein evm_003110 [Chilo suppressalis]